MAQSSRDRKLAHNRAHRDLGLIYDKLPMIAETVSAPRQQRAPGTNDDPRPLEKEVLRDVWKFLAHHPKVAWISRFNSSAFSFEYGGKERWVRANYKKGCSDLLGQMKAAYGGRLIAVEVKREGEPLMDHQRAFLNEVRAAGGVAFVARNLTDCERELG